jgi:hypothetical protein
MKKIVISILMLFIALCSLFAQKRNSDFPVLQGPYLGQQLPGLTPEIFAPGIISTQKNEHSFPAFSPKGDEVFWSSYNDKGDFQTIYYMKQINGTWSKPAVAWFSGEFTEGTASFSVEGDKLFFSSFRSIDGKKTKAANIWYLNKVDGDWIGPTKLGKKLNTENMEFFPYLTNRNVMYLEKTLMGVENNFGIYRTEYVNGEYIVPTLLGSKINTKYLDWTPCVDPNETVLIFASNRPGTYGSSDLYFCFKKTDDRWSSPVNMGPKINTDRIERFPGLSPDGKYLFFVRGYGDVYWVDAKIIEDLKPEE